MKNNKKVPVKFWEDRFYFQHFMQIFVFCSKSVIITTLTEFCGEPAPIHHADFEGPDIKGENLRQDHVLITVYNFCIKRK